MGRGVSKAAGGIALTVLVLGIVLVYAGAAYGLWLFTMYMHVENGPAALAFAIVVDGLAVVFGGIFLLWLSDV